MTMIKVTDKREFKTTRVKLSSVDRGVLVSGTFNSDPFLGIVAKIYPKCEGVSIFDLNNSLIRVFSEEDSDRIKVQRIDYEINMLENIDE